MVQQNELVTLLIAVGVLIFMAANFDRLKRIPAWPWFFGAYAILMAGWVLTVLEGFFWPEILNLFEHLCYGASALVLAVWAGHAAKETGRWPST